MKPIFLLSIAIMALSACAPTQQQSLQSLSEKERLAAAHDELESVMKKRDKQVQDAENLAKPAKDACIEKRQAGVIKTYEESAQCSNQAIVFAFERVEFPYMDLVQQYADKRVELLRKLDKKEITRATFKKQFREYLKTFMDQTYARDSDKLVAKFAG
ncbi:MAG: hypothetical protein SFT92_04985 [Rickettsiales bacterium]|nr:hypothetical protein [Rickettsiales bacterium]